MKAQAGKLKGAIVITSPIQQYAIRADRPAASGDLKPPNRAPSAAAAERRAARAAEGGRRRRSTIEPNIGEHGTVFVTGRDMGANAVPSIVLASEHYNLVAKMLQQKIPVKLAVEIQATLQRGRSQHAQRDRRDSRHRQRAQGRDRHGRRAPRLVAHRHRRDRQRRRQRHGDGSDAHPEGARRPAAAHHSRRAVGGRRTGPARIEGVRRSNISPATRTRRRATSSRSTSTSTTAFRRSAASTWKATMRRARS